MEHEWNNQVSSYRAPVNAVATLKTCDSLHHYLAPETFKSHFAPHRLYFFKESFA